MNATMTGRSVCLVVNGMIAIATLWIAMYPFLSLHDIDLRTLVWDQVSDHKEVFAKSVDVVLAYQPCNLKHVRNDEKFTYNIFNSADVKDMLKVCGEMVRPGKVTISSAAR